MSSEHSLSTSDQEQWQLLKALRESEILRELSELLASSLDTTRILQVLVRRTTEVCEVERCAVWLLDDASEILFPSAYHIFSPRLKSKEVQVADHMWRRSSLPFKDPILGRLLQENGILVIDDLRTEHTMRLIAEKFFVQSILLVALLREGRPVGMMSLDNPGRRSVFTEEQCQLARSIGQQAAVAIDNARLYQQAQEQRQRAERLIERAQSIYQVALAVNSDKDLPSVLEIASQHLVRGLNADGATFTLIEGDTLSIVKTTKLRPLASFPPDSYVIPSLNDLPHCYTTALQGIPLFVKQEHVEGVEKLWCSQLGLENILIVPLMAGTQYRETPGVRGVAISETIHCVGFAFVTYHEASDQPTPGQRAFAQDIAAQCALAIEKANLLTEARQAATLATERATTLDAVLNTMTEGIIVLDLEGKVVISNNTSAHFVGLTEISDRQLLNYLHNNPPYTIWGTPISPEDFALSRALRGEHIRGERFMTKRADGTERLIEVNITPLFNSEATKIGIVSAFRDITEQVRVERRVRRALDTMLHAAEAVSGIMDTKNMMQRVLSMTLTAINSKRGMVLLYDQNQDFIPLLWVGFTEEAAQQWLTEQICWLKPGEEQYAGFRDQLLEGHATLVSAEQSPDQSDILHHTMVLAAPITHNNRLLGIMMLDRSSTSHKDTTHSQSSEESPTEERREFSIWDIAVAEGIAQFAGLAIEQARWQQEAVIARSNEATMRASNALKDEFLAITAHEFRTPLTVILAHSQMMGRVLRRAAEVKPEVREKLQDSMGNIEIQTHQLTNIVNTFLEVTRLNRGQIVLSLEEINLDDVARQAVESYSTTSSIHSISCQINPGKIPYHIMGDKARLHQILANLLQNAIKYSPFGGPITVSLSQCTDDEEHKLAEVCVEDKGIGVPKDAQSHLFERFYRAPNIEGSQTRGVGLGLYVVAQFLRLHNGTIHVESSGISGEGSRFIFTLPLLESRLDA